MREEGREEEGKKERERGRDGERRIKHILIISFSPESE